MYGRGAHRAHAGVVGEKKEGRGLSTQSFVEQDGNVSSTRSGSGRTAEAVEREELHVLMSPEQNVQRIMSTGAVWFVAAVGSSAVFLGLLLSSGWRPTELPLPLAGIWWLGSLLVAGSLGLIGWSGCPILEVDVPTADRNKTKTMQFGTAFFIVGSVLTVFAVLLS